MGGVVNPPVIPSANPQVGVTTVTGSQTDSLLRTDSAGLLQCDQLFPAVVTAGPSYRIQPGGYGVVGAAYIESQIGANQSQLSTGQHSSRQVSMGASTTVAQINFVTNTKALNFGYGSAAGDFEIDSVLGDPVNFKSASGIVGGWNGNGFFTRNANRLLSTTVALTNFAAANVATLNNAPVAGDPVKWIAIDDNGTSRKIPTW